MTATGRPTRGAPRRSGSRGPAGCWWQEQQLIASDRAARDFFGISVALSGDTALVEAPHQVVGGNTHQAGYATVVLSSCFEALNRDYYCQLTVIGVFAQATIAQEVQDGQFAIRTDKPNVKVSWQVTGIRQDPWPETNPIVVEEDKPIDEQGTYLHPETYGLPQSRGLAYKEALERAAGEPHEGG